MSAPELPTGFGIACLEESDDALVICDRCDLERIGIPEVGARMERRFDERLDRSVEDFVPRRLGNGEMELGVEACEFAHTDVLRAVSPFQCAGHVAVDSTEPSDFAPGDGLGCQTGRVGLQLCADLVGLAHLGRRNASDGRATVRLGADKFFHLEHCECLADRGSADAELRRDLAFEQPGIGWEIARENCSAKGEIRIASVRTPRRKRVQHWYTAYRQTCHNRLYGDETDRARKGSGTEDTLGTRVALENATVFTGTGDVLTDATVVVDGERIEWVGNASAAPVDGAERIDLSGRTILPGLVDAHAHLVYDDVQAAYTLELAKPLEQAAIEAAMHAEKLLRLGITSIRDVGTRGNIAVVVRNAVNDGRIPGPRIKASKQIISVWGGLGDMHPTHIFRREQYATALTEIATGPWELRDVVRQQVKDGVDWVKVEASGTGFNPLCPAERDTMSEEELRAVVAEATEKERPVVCHAESRRSIIKAARAGVRTIEHAVYLDDEGLEAVLEHDVAICPTLGLYTAYGEQGLGLGIPPEVVSNHRRTHEYHVAAIRKAWDAGATIIAGSDSGLTVFPQGGLLDEVCTYVEQIGLTESEALLTATRTAATVIGFGDEVGTLEAGKFADLAVYRENPLERIRVLTEPEQILAVLKGGSVVAGEPLFSEGTTADVAESAVVA